jgi:hypothetical protein
LDLATLALGGVCTWWLLPILGNVAFLIPIALGHFFLFCNVVRVHRNYELLWSGAFVVNVAAWAIVDDFSWLKVLAVQTPLTCALVIRECRNSRYHGIFCGPETPEIESAERSDRTSSQ